MSLPTKRSTTDSAAAAASSSSSAARSPPVKKAKNGLQHHPHQDCNLSPSHDVVFDPKSMALDDDLRTDDPTALPNARGIMASNLTRKKATKHGIQCNKRVFFEHERLGEAVERTLLNHLLKMFTALGIYAESFEKPFLECRSDLKYMQQSDVPDYLKHVEVLHSPTYIICSATSIDNIMCS